MKKKIPELIQVILCWINIFCHQSIQNILTDFDRFTKIYTNCSKNSKSNVVFWVNWWQNILIWQRTTPCTGVNNEKDNEKNVIKQKLKNSPWPMILADVVCNSRSLERSPPTEDSLTKLALSGWLAVSSAFMFLLSILLASGLLRSKLSQKYLGVSSAFEAGNELKDVAPFEKNNTGTGYRK